jgi:hypothetical protein
MPGTWTLRRQVDGAVSGERLSSICHSPSRGMVTRCAEAKPAVSKHEASRDRLILMKSQSAPLTGNGRLQYYARSPRPVNSE